MSASATAERTAAEIRSELQSMKDREADQLRRQERLTAEREAAREALGRCLARGSGNEDALRAEVRDLEAGCREIEYTLPVLQRDQQALQAELEQAETAEANAALSTASQRLEQARDAVIAGILAAWEQSISPLSDDLTAAFQAHRTASSIAAEKSGRHFRQTAATILGAGGPGTVTNVLHALAGFVALHTPQPANVESTTPPTQGERSHAEIKKPCA